MLYLFIACYKKKRHDYVLNSLLTSLKLFEFVLQLVKGTCLLNMYFDAEEKKANLKSYLTCRTSSL